VRISEGPESTWWRCGAALLNDVGRFVGGLMIIAGEPYAPEIEPQTGVSVEENNPRVIYEADVFYKDGSQIAAEGRAQVRQIRS